MSSILVPLDGTCFGELAVPYADRLARAIMQTHIRHMAREASARSAAAMMADYNLLVLPVVDRRGEMLGVITADDALDLLLSGDNRD